MPSSHVGQGQAPGHDTDQFRFLVERTTEYAIFMLDPGGHILTWNQGAERLKGYGADEIIGQHFSRFYPQEALDRGWPDHELKVAVAEGRFEDEGWRVRKDGTQFWANVVITALRDDDGQLRGFSKVTRDLSARRLAEEALRESEERFRLMVEGVKDYAIFMLDAEGNIASWNPGAERIKGYRADEIIGQHFSRFYPQEAIDRGWPDYELKVARAEGRFEDEGWRLRKDGTPFWANVVITTLYDRAGNFRGFSKVTRDLTERKRSEENARRLIEESIARQAAEENARLIHEERERLRVTLASIGDAVIATDADGRVEFLNEVAEKLVGVTVSEAAGSPLADVFHIVNAETRQPVENPALRALDEGTIIGLANHTVLISRDRTERPIDDSAAPIRAANGDIIGCVLVFRDVSEKKQADEALRQSERQFRQLADAMPQIVWTAGPDGQIDYMNHRWTEFTGLPPTVSNQGWVGLLHPDDGKIARQHWEVSVKSGSTFDMAVRLRDRSRQSYRWHLIRTTAVHDEAGNVARWYGSSTDIHEQKRIQEASHYLAEASATLATVVDLESTLQKIANLAVPFFADWAAVDLQRNGQLRRLAVAHQDAAKIELARQLHQEYPPDPEAKGGLGAVLRTGQAEMVSDISDELLVKGARDARHLELIRSLGLRSYICVPLIVSGTTIGALTFATSESGRRYDTEDLAMAADLARRASIAVENTELYQALRDADRRKDEFLATLVLCQSSNDGSAGAEPGVCVGWDKRACERGPTIAHWWARAAYEPLVPPYGIHQSTTDRALAHELRNPLAPIRNSLEILKMPHIAAEIAVSARDLMERQVHHLVRLVDDLLDVSRIMRGKIVLRKERIELATIVARAVETVQSLIDSQGHALSIRLTQESLAIDADPVRLTQVIVNLLTNAAKYTEPRGRIEVEADRDGDTALLVVRDTGIGVPAETLPRIFDLFVQVDHAAVRSQGGLGIGLTLVRNLVELHNGTVEARSGGSGKGSEFIVRLPLASSALAASQNGVTPDDQRPPAPSGHRLLVVDDNQDAANSLGTLLRLQGHAVQIAYSGMAAIEIAKEFVPNVVLVDIGMPGMDGYEVAMHLRELPAMEKAMLIALTGWGQQEDRRRSADAGFERHLVKPLDLKVLQTILDELPSRK